MATGRTQKLAYLYGVAEIIPKLKMLTKSCSWIFSQNFDSELFLAFLKREFSAFVNIPNSHLNFSVDIDNFFDRRSFDQTKEIMTNNLWLIIDEVSNRLYKLNSLLKSWVQIGPFNKQFSGQKRSENDKNRVFPGYLACYPIIFFDPTINKVIYGDFFFDV